jgi:hypothetical protein
MLYGLSAYVVTIHLQVLDAEKVGHLNPDELKKLLMTEGNMLFARVSHPQASLSPRRRRMR